mgnify:CR=1 FL=1
MKRLAPSERMRQELFEAVATNGAPLGEAARRGAQLMLLSSDTIPIGKCEAAQFNRCREFPHIFDLLSGPVDAVAILLT